MLKYTYSTIKKKRKYKIRLIDGSRFDLRKENWELTISISTLNRPERTIGIHFRFDNAANKSYALSWFRYVKLLSMYCKLLLIFLRCFKVFPLELVKFKLLIWLLVFSPKGQGQLWRPSCYTRNIFVFSGRNMSSDARTAQTEANNAKNKVSIGYYSPV